VLSESHSFFATFERLGGSGHLALRWLNMWLAKVSGLVGAGMGNCLLPCRYCQWLERGDARKVAVTILWSEVKC
jgi:hypothetical protein